MSGKVENAGNTRRYFFLSTTRAAAIWRRPICRTGTGIGRHRAGYLGTERGTITNINIRRPRSLWWYGVRRQPFRCQESRVPAASALPVPREHVSTYPLLPSSPFRCRAPLRFVPRRDRSCFLLVSTGQRQARDVPAASFRFSDSRFLRARNMRYSRPFSAARLNNSSDGETSNLVTFTFASRHASHVSVRLCLDLGYTGRQPVTASSRTARFRARGHRKTCNERLVGHVGNAGLTANNRRQRNADERVGLRQRRKRRGRQAGRRLHTRRQ